jgi:cobyrinic acid a,c-diamide synthase
VEEEMAEEEEEAKGPHAMPSVVRMQAMLQKTISTIEWRELKEKDDTARSNEASKHVFHSATREIAPQQLFSHPYIPTSNNALQQPNYS